MHDETISSDRTYTHTRVFSGKGLYVTGTPCTVLVRFTEETDTISGDSIESVSVLDIVDNMGQTIMPATLSIPDFRCLIRDLRRQLQLSTL